MLGIFRLPQQARRYVSEQANGDRIQWRPARPGAPVWQGRCGCYTYLVEHHAVRDRQNVLRHVVASRSWRLRCGHCGTEWTATAEDVLAGEGWLACPACHDESSHLAGGALGEELRRGAAGTLPGRADADVVTGTDRMPPW